MQHPGPRPPQELWTPWGIERSFLWASSSMPVPGVLAQLGHLGSSKWRTGCDDELERAGESVPEPIGLLLRRACSETPKRQHIRRCRHCCCSAGRLLRDVASVVLAGGCYCLIPENRETVVVMIALLVVALVGV